MADLVTRPYADGDAESLTHLLNELDVADGGKPLFTADYARSLVAAEVGDPARDTRLVLAPDGMPAACAMVMQPPLGGSRAHLLGGVHPRWRACGIGRSLLSWQLDRIAEILALRNPGITWRAGTGASAANESAARLFKRFNLQPARYFHDMSAPTAGAPEARPPDGIHLVEYTRELLAGLYEADMEAFADHWGFERTGIDEWMTGTVDSESFRGDLSRIALDGDEIAAYLLAYDSVGDVVYIGEVGTRRRWRKRGLATALLAATLAASAVAGKATAALRVDADSPTGAVGIYQRVGFVARSSPHIAYDTALAP